MVHHPDSPGSAEVAPDTHVDLLERPLFGHLATVRPDGSPQSSVMWFAWDGELLRFTHRTDRQKYVNLQAEPRVSLSIHDPDQPYRFLEVRGVVESVMPDPGGAFYAELQQRYGVSYRRPAAELATRVVITVRPTAFVAVEQGMTARERRRLEERTIAEADIGRSR